MSEEFGPGSEFDIRIKGRNAEELLDALLKITDVERHILFTEVPGARRVIELDEKREKAAAPVPAKIAVKREFIIGVADKQYEQPLRDAVKNDSVLANDIEVRTFASFDAFNAVISAEKMRGAFVDESYLKDPKLGIPHLMTDLTLQASRVFISPRTIDELRAIMAKIKELLPKIKAVNIDEAVALRKELTAQQGLLRDAYINHMAVLNRSFGLNINKAISGALDAKKSVAIALTERTVENDLFSASSMEEVAKNDSVRPFFIYNIYNIPIAGRKPILTQRDAEEYLSLCGYSPAVIAKMQYINAAPNGVRLAYSQIMENISKTAGVADNNIGMAAIENEFTRSAADKGVLLEVGSVTMGGKTFYASVNTVQTLLNVLTQFNGRTLDNEVPDVAKKADGVFLYLPRAIPIDYNRELEAYREAVMLVRTAA
jgi:hypothetical protein